MSLCFQPCIEQLLVTIHRAKDLPQGSFSGMPGGLIEMAKLSFCCPHISLVICYRERSTTKLGSAVSSLLFASISIFMSM